VSRRAPLLVLALLLAVLGVSLALVVPWTPLPGADVQPDAALDFTPAQIAREVAFHDALRPTSYASLALGLVVVSVLGLTRLGARLVRAAARPLGGGWVWQVLLGTLAVTVVVRLATLPLRARSETVLREYGLSTQTWGSWSLDVLRGVLVDAGLSALALLAVVGTARVARRTWWAWSAGATAALVVAGSFAYPLVVEPVFNSFTSLPAGPLRTAVLELAERDGVEVDDVLVADASRRTTALNAYVSGFSSSRRVVLYDTLVERATPEEVALVVAHELGHVEQDDVLVGTLLGALGTAAAVCGLAVLLSWSPVLRRSGADGPHDPRIVPLLLALVAVGTLVLAPAGNLVSRRVEARADVHSLELTRDPHPLAYALFATHPSTTERLALVREWVRLRGPA
jgi:STE24 endopeptidase